MTLSFWMLARQGEDPWAWGNQAALRQMQWKYANGQAPYSGFRWQIPVIEDAYGIDLPGNDPADGLDQHGLRRLVGAVTSPRTAHRLSAPSGAGRLCASGVRGAFAGSGRRADADAAKRAPLHNTEWWRAGLDTPHFQQFRFPRSGTCRPHGRGSRQPLISRDTCPSRTTGATTRREDAERDHPRWSWHRCFRPHHDLTG